MHVAAGFGQARITPDRPLPLAGIGGARIGRETLDDLYVRALSIQDGQTTLVLTSLDTLYVSRELCARLEQWIEATHSIPAVRLFVAATHTHCAPLLLDSYFDDVVIDASYLEFVIEQTQSAIEAALASPVDALMEFSTGHAPVSINRQARRLDRNSVRALRPKRTMANRPNPVGPVDNQVHTVWLRTSGSDVPDIALVSAGCHPSILRNDVYSADFPGRIEGHLNANRERPARVIFLQGFSGDTRPQLLEAAPFAIWPPGRAFEWLFDRQRFRKDSSVRDTEAVAGALAAAIVSAPLRQAKNVSLSASRSELLLPLAERPDVEDLGKIANSAQEPAPRRRYARFVLDSYAAASVPLQMHRWCLADDIQLVGVAGEVFSAFALPLPSGRSAGEGLTVPVGCVGGMVGYIPTAATLAGGGYEVDRSRQLFGLPSRFAPSIEPMIRDALGTAATADPPISTANSNRTAWRADRATSA